MDAWHTFLISLHARRSLPRSLTPVVPLRMPIFPAVTQSACLHALTLSLSPWPNRRTIPLTIRATKVRLPPFRLANPRNWQKLINPSDHRNGIKKPKKQTIPSRKGVRYHFNIAPSQLPLFFPIETPFRTLTRFALLALRAFRYAFTDGSQVLEEPKIRLEGHYSCA